MDVDMSKLTPLQRRNIAALEIKKEQLKHRFGTGITIITTMDELLRETGPMAIPVSQLETTKPVSIRCREIIEDIDGGKRNNGKTVLPDDVEDLQQVLDNTVASIRARNEERNRRLVEEFEVPQGYKLVKIDEEDPTPVDAVDTTTVAISTTADAYEELQESSDDFGKLVSTVPVTDEVTVQALKELQDLLK